MRFKVIIFSAIISILGFLGFYSNSYCQALPDFILDPNSFEVLEGGAYSNTYQFGMIDYGSPAFVFGVDAAIQDINTKLYNKFGWDLEDVGWALEDNAGTGTSADNLAYAMSDGAFVSMALAAAEGNKIFWRNAMILGNGLVGQAKQFIMGKVDQLTGKITDVQDNVITYIDDDFIGGLNEVFDDLKDDGDVVNMTSKNYLYGTDFFIDRGSEKWNLHFNDPIYICAGTNANYYLYAAVPYNTSFSGGGSYINVSTTWSINSYIVQNPTYTITIDGITYYVGPLKFFRDGSWWNIYSNHFGDLSAMVNELNNSSGLNDSAYYYSLNQAQALASLLEQLKGHYITSSDLKRINEFIGDIPVERVVPSGGGSAVPIINPSADDLSDLEDLVLDIISNSEGYEDLLAEYEVDPEPVPDPEPEEPIDYTGTIVPDNFPTGITEPILDLFDFNFNLFSFFEPLFYIFGTFSGIYALWSFVPLVIIIMVVIWALK